MSDKKRHHVGEARGYARILLFLSVSNLNPTKV